jgi:hypothetical protein
MAVNNLSFCSFTLCREVEADLYLLGTRSRFAEKKHLSQGKHKILLLERIRRGRLLRRSDEQS